MIEEGYTWYSRRGALLTSTKVFKNENTKRWVSLVHCEICSKDKELFPEIISCVSVIERGCSPCACNKNYRWNKDQHVMRIKRVCEELGYTFEGFEEGVFKGNNTKIKLYNPTSGNRWSSCTIDNFHRGRRDPSLRNSRMSEKHSLNRDKKVKSVIENYKLYDTMYDTNWSLVEREGSKDRKDIVISYSCRNCGFTSVRVDKYNLKRDKVSCGCSGTTGYYHKRELETDNLYIAVREEDNLTKIGRTFCVEDRVLGINKTFKGYWDFMYTVKGVHKDIYELEQSLLYKFARFRLFSEGDEIFGEGFDVVVKNYLEQEGYILDKVFGEDQYE